MSHRAPNPAPRNDDQAFSVRLVSGEVVFTGPIEDALRINRTLWGQQSRVWSHDGRAMTLPKLFGVRRAHLVQLHERELAFAEGLVGRDDVLRGGGMRDVQERALAARARR